MAKGCLAALFGIRVRPSGSSRPGVPDEVDSSGMSEGEIHSGPGGYQEMGYSGGYAAEYLAEQDNEDWDEGDEA